MAVFPGQPPNPLGLKVEINLNGTWTDISSYMMQRDMLQITGMGRTDESVTIQPSQLTLTLKNTDGRFTPKNTAGAYYPYIVRNTPIRVSVNATSATSTAYSGYRYNGEVSSWPPTSDVSQHDLYVQAVASGIWRRISQSQATIGSSYARYMAQLSGTSVPATSWTMEDGNGSAGFAVAIGGGSAGTFTGTPSFAADGTSFPGSDALPQFNNSKMTFPVASGATATDNVTRYALSVPASGDPNAGGIQWNISETDSTGTAAKLEVFLNPSGTLAFEAHNAAGATLFTATTKTNVQGHPLLISAELTPAGGTVDYALRIIAPNGASVLESVTGSFTGTIGTVTRVLLNRSGVLSSTTVGQLGVFYAVPDLIIAASALGGRIGEFAVVRFQRLCAEFGIATEIIGSASAAMGPQVDDTLANLLQVIENTDGGLLYEPADIFGLGYRTLGSLQNQSPAVTVNYAAGSLGAPLPATYDDMLLKNQWTVTNWDGYTALATLVSGALSIQPVPAGAGLYAGGPLSISAQSDAQANAIAQLRLFQGTIDDVRYPQLTFDARRPQYAPLFAAVPGLRIGDYLQIANLPAFEGGGTAKQLAYGWTETLNSFTWTLVYNTIPELPFESTYTPGTYTVVQAPSGTTAFGSGVGSSVSGSQIGEGSVGSDELSSDISARTLGGTTAFTGPAIPYDWSFNVSGSPADATYFTATAQQAFPIAIGDTFSSSLGLGGPFTVTTLDPPSGGNVNVHFTPTATAVMTSGTVSGGKNGDLWVNTSGGYQVNIWADGNWTPITWSASSVLSAGTITAGLLAAGIIVAGIVNATTITGAQFISTGSMGADYLAYTGSEAAGNLAMSYAEAPGTDSVGNAFLAGFTVYTGTSGAWLALNISPSTTGFSWYTSSATTQTGWSAQGELFPQASGPLQVRNSGFGFQVGTSGTNEFIQMTAYALFNALASTPAVPGNGIQLYAGSHSLWSQNAQGWNQPLERSSVALGNRSAGNNTTLTQLSDAVFYLANEGSGLVAEYEIECRGSGTWPQTTAETLTIGIFLNGGANCTSTIGTNPLMALGDNFSFTFRATITVVSTGTSGSVNLHTDGQICDTTNNRYFYDPFNTEPGGAPIGRDLANVSFNTTVAQDMYICAQWGGAGGSAQIITAWSTKITRRGG